MAARLAQPCPSKDLDALAVSSDNAGNKPEEPGFQQPGSFFVQKGIFGDLMHFARLPNSVAWDDNAHSWFDECKQNTTMSL